MEEDGILSAFQLHNNEPKIWYINNSPKNVEHLKKLEWVPQDFVPFPDPPHNWYIRQHELLVGDLFIAWKDHITHWDTKWFPKEVKDLGIGQFRINYDARMVYNGKVYLHEADSGSEDVDVQLEPKVEKYTALAEALPYGSFQVLFTLSKYRRMSLPNRIGYLTALLQEHKRGNQFLVASHDAVIADPTGPVWISPLQPEVKRTLADLTYGP